MVGYNGKNYIFNVPEICKFFMYSDGTEFKEKEVTDGFEKAEGEDGEMILVSKIIRESRTPGSGAIDNIKYDFIKLLISQVMAGNTSNLQDPGFIITMDTLINYNFLIEYNKEDNE